MSKNLDLTEGEKSIFRKRERLTVSQWAEKYRRVTSGPAPGPWRNSFTPYLVEPMDELNKPWVRKIFMMFAPQVGKTQVAFNFLGYKSDYDPGDFMYVMPDEAVAKRISQKRIRPLFKDSPRLSALLSEKQDEVSTLSIQLKNGATVWLVWAGSASKLASESVPYMIFDETDKYPEFTGKEADPLSLGEVRTTAFPHTKKLIYCSTPTTEEGFIARLFASEADEIRHWWVVCPSCGKEQRMTFDRFFWSAKVKDPREIVRSRLARYECEFCPAKWDDQMRDQATAKGFWLAENPIEKAQAPGFKFPSWNSPFVSLSDVVAAYLKGLEDPAKMMAFVTQHKAEPWKESVDVKSEDTVLSLRTSFPPGVVPKEAVALTAGIDMQQRGFWFVVRAWAPDLTSWLIDYGQLLNWEAIYSLVYEASWPVMGNDQVRKRIWRAALDTGGGMRGNEEWSRTEEAYQWLREHGGNTVFGTKGASHPQIKRVMPRLIDKMQRTGKAIPDGIELYFLDTDQLKELIDWRMKRSEGEGQRFNLHSQTKLDYVKQMKAEEKSRDKNGKIFWKRVSRDNHLLDCECMAAACADYEWVPSLQMLCGQSDVSVVKGIVHTESKRQDVSRNNIQFTGRSRPSWLTNRR